MALFNNIFMFVFAMRHLIVLPCHFLSEAINLNFRNIIFQYEMKEKT